MSLPPPPSPVVVVENYLYNHRAKYGKSNGQYVISLCYTFVFLHSRHFQYEVTRRITTGISFPQAISQAQRTPFTNYGL
jgi:hypothetical protein